MFKKKSRFKPLYRKFLLYRGDVQKRSKIRRFKLKKKKWERFFITVSRHQKRYRKFKSHNQQLFKLSKFASKFNAMKSNYKNALIAGKRFNLFYGGLSKKYIKTQIKNIFKKQRTTHSKNNITLDILKFFESRLDAVIYRAHFSESMRNARQLIKHKHVFVNNKIETNYSRLLKNGDFIEINPESYKLMKKIFTYNVFWPAPPKHIHVNYKTMQILFGNIKESRFVHDFHFWLNLYLVIQHYQRH